MKGGGWDLRGEGLVCGTRMVEGDIEGFEG